MKSFKSFELYIKRLNELKTNKKIFKKNQEIISIYGSKYVKHNSFKTHKEENYKSNAEQVY